MALTNFFEIRTKLPGSLARTGVLSTPHGLIHTPAFIVAGTKAAVKALTAAQVSQLGGQAILSNTYHLILQPGTELIQQAGGLAEFMGWHRPTFTDSGGFQIMSLPGVKITPDGATFRSHINGDQLTITPESSMQAQHQIGSDIHMAFDCPIGYGNAATAAKTTRQNAEQTLHLTHTWAERCLIEHERLNGDLPELVQSDVSEGGSPREKRDRPVATGAGDAVRGWTSSCKSCLYGVVQGGEYMDLRQQSATHFANQPFDGYGIGGMYMAEKSQKYLQAVNQILPETKPRHWLGMGAEPIDLFIGIELGIDTFDCVAPTRQARNGALYTHQGRINIQNAKYRTDFTPIDQDCDCYTCQNFTRSYLTHLFRAKEILAPVLASIHNERIVVRTVDQIRASIESGTFHQFKTQFLNTYYQT